MMSAAISRRMPAYGRQVAKQLNAGMLPAIGDNLVVVCIGWPRRCVFAHVVCMRDERPADGWDFDFLVGVETMVWFDREDRSYAEEVRRELLKAGCPLVVLMQRPEDEQ